MNKDDFLMLPKIDFCFKELMHNKKILTGFLAAVLNYNPDEIKEVRIMNTFLQKEQEEDKQGILDVRVELNDSIEIDIEIQLSYFMSWPERSLFYLSKMFTEQLRVGEDYQKLKRCIAINLLDFDLLKDTDEFYSVFHFREDTRHTLYSDKLEIHIIELPKLPIELREADNLLLWAKFINAKSKEEFEMLARKDEYIEEAYDNLQVISHDEQKKAEYEARQKAIRDYNSLRREGLDEGKREGLEQGLRQGLEQGLEKGKELGLVQVAKNMLEKGMDIKDISDLTGLSLELIEGLKVPSKE